MIDGNMEIYSRHVREKEKKITLFLIWNIEILTLNTLIQITI